MRAEKTEPLQEPTPENSAPATPTEIRPSQAPRTFLGGFTVPGSYSGRKARLVGVLAVLLVLLLGYGLYWMIWLRGTISTDDAYVDARIIAVSSRVPGRVESVAVEEGQEVTPGMTLAVLASDKLIILLNQRTAELQGAQAKLAELRKGAREEEIAVNRAEVRALEVELFRKESILRRLEGLAAVQPIARQELDSRREEAERARAELEVSRNRLALLLSGTRQEQIARADAELKLAKARLEEAEANLADGVVVAPVAGIVAKRMVNPGEFVQEGQGLFRIVETEKTWVVVNLEEDDIGRIRVGQSATIQVDAYSGRKLKGRVGAVFAATLSRFSMLSSATSSGNFIKVTQRIPVRIDWAEDNLPPMYPGLNVVVRIVVRD